MTPLWARWARARQVVRCWIGQHELAAEVPATETAARQPIIRQRCLHCGQVSDGWEIGADGPRYRTTHEADRARLVLHNGRLRRCPCAACEQRRHARRRQRVVVLKKTG